MEPHWLWLIAAATLGLAELVFPGIFLIWIAAAAALTALLTAVTGIGVLFQFTLFALLSIACVLAVKRWYRAYPVATEDPLLNDRAARLIGRTVMVVTAIENGVGRVKVGDSVWNCRGPDCAAGTPVRVVAAQGTCLDVEPVTLAAEERPLLPERE
jgi:hypothetical protein